MFTRSSLRLHNAFSAFSAALSHSLLRQMSARLSALFQSGRNALRKICKAGSADDEKTGNARKATVSVIRIRQRRHSRQNFEKGDISLFPFCRRGYIIHKTRPCCKNCCRCSVFRSICRFLPRYTRGFSVAGRSAAADRTGAKRQCKDNGQYGGTVGASAKREPRTLRH